MDNSLTVNTMLYMCFPNFIKSINLQRIYIDHSGPIIPDSLGEL